MKEWKKIFPAYIYGGRITMTQEKGEEEGKNPTFSVHITHTHTLIRTAHDTRGWNNKKRKRNGNGIYISFVCTTRYNMFPNWTKIHSIHGMAKKDCAKITDSKNIYSGVSAIEARNRIHNGTTVWQWPQPVLRMFHCPKWKNICKKNKKRKNRTVKGEKGVIEQKRRRRSTSVY